MLFCLFGACIAFRMVILEFIRIICTLKHVQFLFVYILLWAFWNTYTLALSCLFPRPKTELWAKKKGTLITAAYGRQVFLFVFVRFFWEKKHKAKSSTNDYNSRVNPRLQWFEEPKSARFFFGPPKNASPLVAQTSDLGINGWKYAWLFKTLTPPLNTIAWKILRNWKCAKELSVDYHPFHTSDGSSIPAWLWCI